MKNISIKASISFAIILFCLSAEGTAQVGGDWVVTQGVAFGDRVVVAGLQYAQPGVTVTPVPATKEAKGN